MQVSFEAAERLNSLFGEVNTLATQCKQARPPFQDQGDVAGGMRGVLAVLGRNGGQTVPDIARARSTSRQNIQIVVNRLKSQGLIEFIRNPNHKKSSVVQLTAKGQSLVELIEDAEAKLLNQVLSDLSPDELALATRCLQTLRHALQNETTAPNGNGRIASAQVSAPKRKLEHNGNPPSQNPRSEEGNLSGDQDFPVNLL